VANTYGGYIANRNHPGWRGEIEQRVTALLERMEALGLVEHDGENLQLSLLGRACGSAALSFASAMLLVELLRNVGAEGLTAEKLMAIIQILPESDGGYTRMMKRGSGEAIRQREAVDRFGQETIRLLQGKARDIHDYYARCKRAAILWDWIHGVSIEEIEQRYSATPYQGRIELGDVRKFADNTRFHLRSAHQIATVMFMGQGPDEEAVEVLLKRLEVGIPADALGLLELPLSLARGEYLALYHAGVTDLEAFWALDSERVVDLIGRSRAELIDRQRPAQAELITV
jgi:replicative superfamily II helicase